MNKVDTVSLVNLIMPKPETSKVSWTDSAFKDIFSINNSNNNKSNKSNNDIYTDKQRQDNSNYQAKKNKESKLEPFIKPKEAQRKNQENVTDGKTQQSKQEINTENNIKTVDEIKLEPSKSESTEQVDNAKNLIDNSSIEIARQVAELVQSLVNIELKPEQLEKIVEVTKMIPNELKSMINENPKAALDFIKENVDFLAKTVDLSDKQIQSIQKNINILQETLDTNEDIDLDKLLNLQKTQIQTFNSINKFETKREINTNNIDDINLELNSLKLQPNIVTQQNSLSSNVFSDNQSENLDFIQTDKIEGFDLTGGKLFSNTMLMNSVKKVDIRNNQFMQMISKIADEIRLTVDKNKNEMTIKLQPETLGKLTVKISSENGIMNASFFAENDKAKAMIENHMTELKNSLEKQGIQVQNLTVTVDQNQDELTRHRNLMEAQKYNKAQISQAEFELIENDILDNPYVLEDIFSELI